MSDSVLSAKTRAELAALAGMSDAEIDLQDMPEVLDWHRAQVGKYYRPIKKPISLRVDLDVLSWFQSLGEGYQTKMNRALRNYMDQARRQENSPIRRVKEESADYATRKKKPSKRSKAIRRAH